MHPGSAKCNRQWSQRYGALIDAFQDIVRLQLFGGSSLETFNIFRDLDSGNPVAVATTSAEFNGYSKDLSARVIESDTISNFPIRIRTATISSADLSKKNMDFIDLTVKMDHTYPDDYGMLDLSPSEYAKLANRIENNEEQALMFLK